MGLNEGFRDMPSSPTTAALSRLANWLFWFALAVYVPMLPISHTIAVRNAAFLLLIVATLLLCLARQRLPALPLKTAWAIYAAVALISCSYAVSPIASLGEVRVEIVYCFLIFSIAVTWSQDRDILPAFARVAAVANLLLVVTALAMAGFDTPIEEILALPGWARAGLSANYLLAVAPLLALFSWRLWTAGKRPLAAGLALILLLDVLAMIVSYNRQALLALAAGIFCAGVLLIKDRFSWRRCAVLAAVMLVVAGLIVAQMARRAASVETVEANGSVGAVEKVDQLAQTVVTKDVRWALWKFSVEKIIEHPLAGGGFGRTVFDKLYPDFMPDDPMLWHAHNMVLNKGIQMGVPGMLAFLLLWLALLRAYSAQLRAAPRQRAIAIAGIATLVVVFAKNMTDDFFVRDMALWFWLINGILLGSLHYRGSAAARPEPPR